MSGCGTGLNVVVGGDELIGLKRGLLYAGAQGLLADALGRQRPEHGGVHEAVLFAPATDSNKARAIQYAMSEIRRTYAHPFYWAPFVLVGKYA